VAEAERRVGPLKYKVTAAFWNRQHEALLLPPYFTHAFTPVQPEPIKLENAVDFKLQDTIRQAREQALREGEELTRVVLVCGDGDLSHTARALVNDGVSLQIWGGSRNTGDAYIAIVSKDKFVVLDDVSGL